MKVRVDGGPYADAFEVLCPREYPTVGAFQKAWHGGAGSNRGGGARLRLRAKKKTPKWCSWWTCVSADAFFFAANRCIWSMCVWTEAFC